VRVTTRDKRLKAAIEGEQLCKRHYGADMCKKLRLRLNALKAAVSLGDFWPPKSGPERCHELKGSRSGVFSVDVKQPFRLLFRSVEDTPPADIDSDNTDSEAEADGKARWNCITEIELLTIEDTHG
jgi:plasmid maintenance system killer protein